MYKYIFYTLPLYPQFHIYIVILVLTLINWLVITYLLQHYILYIQFIFKICLLELWNLFCFFFNLVIYLFVEL